MSDIKNDPVFHPGKRHYVLCGDEAGMKKLKSVKKILADQLVSFEEIHLFQECSSEVDNHLGRQMIGSYLFVAAEWKTLREFMGLTKKLGYSSEDVQFIIVGEEEKRIFCCRCHFISILKSSITTGDWIPCSGCGLKLELSDHYSPIKDAYLGYVAQT
ncbi:hypothetical protein AB685_05925 [Bacillus sp. LL01]|uniref:hypothetical protein n=1 Tax=Bacillus sp. LL01 TaxID=1665556 RepID=UPI00064D19AF|nr:hypothetical protein [Bacillus sp. LL01]KMJ60350.1 hypothetical protein AB685_05925 [Bacillus sp. LL01]